MKDYYNDSYKGLKIKAIKGVHDLAWGMLKNLNFPKNTQFLDLGAGEGVFSLRLLDNGYKNIDAVDIDKDKFKVNMINCFAYDLNGNFSVLLQKKYDMIIILEVIEHLENPRHFLRNCTEVLKSTGYLLLSTPNIESWVSRIIFFIYGRYNWFSAEDYQTHGHITPLTRNQIFQITNELGYKVIQECATSNKSLRKVFISSSNLVKKVIKLIAFAVSYPIMKGNKSGDIMLYLLQKDKP